MSAWAPGALAPAPAAASRMQMLLAQARAELVLMLRNGEQLLLTMIIPLGLLVGLSTVDAVEVEGRRVDFFVPGVLALAVMSTAFTGQAIATGFDRQYGVLKRLGATPLPRSVLLQAKTLAVLAVELIQVLLLCGVGLVLGWEPHGSFLAALLLVVVGTAAFAGLGLLLGGTLPGLTTLAVANLVWLVLLALGGVVFPLEKYGAAQDVLVYLPTAALADGLREVLQHGELVVRDALVLLGWAVARPDRRLALVPVGMTLVRRLAVSALVLEMVLVLSGAAVRVTGSGLGCPTWPRCTNTSLASTSELGVHGVIEFGNRTLAVVMEAIGILLVLAVRRHVPRLTRLALVQALVVPLQAVIGGILVLSDLNPWVLILHFLTSFPLVYCAAWLLRSLDEPRPLPAVPALRGLTALLVLSSATVLVLGTLVTGTGPHAGDPKVDRLPLNPLTVTRLHTDAVWVLVGLVLATVLLTWGTRLRPWGLLLAGLVAGQGALGYWQYFNGVPPLAVAVHVAGATAVFTTAAWLQLTTWRAPRPPLDGPPARTAPELPATAPGTARAR